MTKEEKKQKLLNLRQVLNEYLLINMNENEEIIEYFNKYFDFTTFEIIEYEQHQFYEYLKFDLSGQTTGNIYEYIYNMIKDEYKLKGKPEIFTAKTDHINISREILIKIFNLARENKALLEADKYLTKKLNKTKNIS